MVVIYIYIHTIYVNFKCYFYIIIIRLYRDYTGSWTIDYSDFDKPLGI